MAHAQVLHCIGTIETGSDFPRDARGVAVRWTVAHSDDWILCEGRGTGTTQWHERAAARQQPRLAVKDRYNNTVVGAAGLAGLALSVTVSALDPAIRVVACEPAGKRLGEALEILTDPFKRQLYDEGHDKASIEERVEAARRADSEMNIPCTVCICSPMHVHT